MSTKHTDPPGSWYCTCCGVNRVRDMQELLFCAVLKATKTIPAAPPTQGVISLTETQTRPAWYWAVTTHQAIGAFYELCEKTWPNNEGWAGYVVSAMEIPGVVREPQP